MAELKCRIDDPSAWVAVDLHGYTAVAALLRSAIGQPGHGRPHPYNAIWDEGCEMYASYAGTEDPHVSVKVYARYAHEEKGSARERLAMAAGRGVVMVVSVDRWCFFYPELGDLDTQTLIEQAANGSVPPSILADRIDDVEPIGDPTHPAFHLTRDLRRTDLQLAVLVC